MFKRNDFRRKIERQLKAAKTDDCSFDSIGTLLSHLIYLLSSIMYFYHSQCFLSHRIIIIIIIINILRFTLRSFPIDGEKVKSQKEASFDNLPFLAPCRHKKTTTQNQNSSFDTRAQSIVFCTRSYFFERVKRVRK